MGIPWAICSWKPLPRKNFKNTCRWDHLHMVGMRTRQLEQQLLSCWISSGCRTHTLGFLFYPPWYPPCPFTLPLFIYLIAIICDIIYSTLSPICNFFLSSRNIICPLTFAPRCCLVAQSCPTLCYPMDCSTPGFPVLHHLPELTQTLVLWVSDTIQPSDRKSVV